MTDFRDENLIPVEFLNRENITCSAENAGIAFLKLEELKTSGEPVDLVLTDIKMPQMSGIQLSSHIDKHNLDIPVAFMSGYPEEEGGNLEGEAFIPKPFTRNSLVKQIRTILDKINSKKQDESEDS